MKGRFSEDEFKKKYSKTLGTQGSDKVWNYFLDLIKTKEFQEATKSLREDIKNEEKHTILWTYHEAERTLTDFGLDSDVWIDVFIDYLRDGTLSKPEGIDMCKVTSVYELMDVLSKEDEADYSSGLAELERIQARMNIKRNFPTALLISPHASMRDIINYVEAHFELGIQNHQLPYIEKTKGPSLGKSKKKNPLIQERNNFIYEHRELPNREIMMLSNDKFGHNLTVDYGYVGKIISNEKRLRKEL